MFSLPKIWQAPMAGVSTPALAAAVSTAGGLGALGLGATPPDRVGALVAEFRARLSGPLNLNVFCHAEPTRDPAREAAWLERLRPEFARFDAAPPPLKKIYTSFIEDDAMLTALIQARPRVVSFHFGLPTPAQLSALRAADITLAACVTGRAEAEAAERAGVQLLVAQGWEAGGHRGVFDPAGADPRLPTLELVRALSPLGLPIVAAGGIVDRAGVQAAFDAGAVAAQLGTAFLNTPEAATREAHRAALSGGKTQMTSAISGRPARCLENRFTEIDDREVAAYPLAYSAGKALNAAAAARGQLGYGAFWAGTGAARAQAAPAEAIVRALLS